MLKLVETLKAIGRNRLCKNKLSTKPNSAVTTFTASDYHIDSYEKNGLCILLDHIRYYRIIIVLLQLFLTFVFGVREC